MNLFDPYHCRVARDLVAKGHDLDAVRILSQSPDRDHRAARQLLAQSQPRLIQWAGQAAEVMLWDRAVELLEAAALCGELPIEAVVLKERVLVGQRRAHEQAQRVEQAKDWAEQGRVVSALDLLRPLEGHADVAVVWGTDSKLDAGPLIWSAEIHRRFPFSPLSFLKDWTNPWAFKKLDRGRERKAVMNPRTPKAANVELCQNQLPATHRGRDQQDNGHSDDHRTSVAASQAVQLQDHQPSRQPAEEGQADREQDRSLTVTVLVQLIVQPIADDRVGKAPSHLPSVQRAIGFEQFVRHFTAIRLCRGPQVRQRSTQSC